MCQGLNFVGRMTAVRVGGGGSCAESIERLSGDVAQAARPSPRIERFATYPSAGSAGVTMVVGPGPVVDDDNRYHLAFTREHGTWKAQPAFGLFPQALVAR